MIIQANAVHIPLKDNSINCCVTSPPYWGLRKYQIPDLIWDEVEGCEHQWGERTEIDDVREETMTGKTRTTERFYGEESRKFNGNHQKHISGQFCLLCGAWRGQLGFEPTIDLYVKHIVDIFREVKRVLRKDGVCFLNLGDSYHGGKGRSNYAFQTKRLSETLNPKHSAICSMYGETRPADMPQAGLKPKDLCGIPWRVALALQADGWWLRSDIIWSKPNPMPESVTDRPTRAHEYLFLLAKSGDTTCWRHDKTGEWVWDKPKPDYVWVKDDKGKEKRVNLWKGHDYFWDQEAVKEKSAWPNGPNSPESISSPYGQGFTRRASWKGSKFEDGKNLEIHPNVGKHRSDDYPRIHGNLPGRDDGGRACNGPGQEYRNIRSVWTIATQPYPESHYATFPEELVERCIKAGSPRAGTVLDPFCGSGTVVKVAERLQRNGIGLDLGYQDLSQKRRQWNQVELCL